MSICRALFMLAIVLALLSVTMVDGGPVRSFATVIASRTAKIPRAIRAPFRNNEMMTARGFGKRSQQTFKFRDGNFVCSINYHQIVLCESFCTFISQKTFSKQTPTCRGPTSQTESVQLKILILHRNY